MKNKLQSCLMVLALLALPTLSNELSTARAQGAAFTYQGQVQDNGTNFTGMGQFQFALITSTNTSSQAMATANPPSGGLITVINVTFEGNGYTSVPTVTISGGGGSGAMATATVSAGEVTAITVNDPGSNYISAPTVMVAPPEANISFTTYWSNDGTSADGSQPATAVPVPVTGGLFTVVLGDTNAGMMSIIPSVFEQLNLQLRIWFSDGVNGFAALSPVQNLTPAPYAIVAQSVVGASFILNAENNIAIGSGALGNNTTGYDDTANGYGTLSSNSVGYQNTAIGFDALNANTSGSNNAANGADALEDNTTGYWNTADGAFALEDNTNGWYNTACGAFALLSNTSGQQNTANGGGALYYNTTGIQNTACGVWALELSTNGSNNIALGFEAGYSLTSGTNNIEIGNIGVDGDNNTIRVGTAQTNAFIAGIYGATAASGIPVYVNPSGQLGTLTSSARFKQDIRGMDEASDELLSLRPVTFRYKPEIDPHGIPQFGLIAEDVDKVDPRLVAQDDKNQIYTVRYEAVNAMLLNEFLKEHRKVEEQETEMQTLKQQNEFLAERLDELEATVRQLAPPK